MPLSMQEITDQLSLREWVKVCAALDAQYVGKRTEIASQHGDGSKFQKVAGKIGAVKFDVTSIRESDDGKGIRVDLIAQDGKAWAFVVERKHVPTQCLSAA